MKKLTILSALLATLGASMPLHALPYATPPTWGGDLATRPRLTGDWGGVRDDLAKKGVVFDADVYWAPQAITGGGKDGATPSLVPVHAGTIEAAPRRAFSVLLAIFPHPIRAPGW